MSRFRRLKECSAKNKTPLNQVRILNLISHILVTNLNINSREKKQNYRLNCLPSMTTMKKMKMKIKKIKKKRNNRIETNK